MDPITNADPSDPSNVLIIFRTVTGDWTWPNARVIRSEHSRVVPRSCTVAELKDIWALSDDRPPADAVNWKAVFSGRILADEESVGFGLDDGSTVYVVLDSGYPHSFPCTCKCSHCDGTFIVVKFSHTTLKDAANDYRIIVDSCDVVWDLKVKYKKHTGRNPDFFDFEYKGVRLGEMHKEFKDGATMKECNLEGDLTLQVVLKSNNP